ncbi:MAG: hypothetical protein ACT4OY_02790 [Alphaproteobacteria bacterium]
MPNQANQNPGQNKNNQPGQEDANRQKKNPAGDQNEKRDDSNQKK